MIGPPYFSSRPLKCRAPAQKNGSTLLTGEGRRDKSACALNQPGQLVWIATHSRSAA